MSRRQSDLLPALDYLGTVMTALQMGLPLPPREELSVNDTVGRVERALHELHDQVLEEWRRPIGGPR